MPLQTSPYPRLHWSRSGPVKPCLPTNHFFHNSDWKDVYSKPVSMPWFAFLHVSPNFISSFLTTLESPVFSAAFSPCHFIPLITLTRKKTTVTSFSYLDSLLFTPLLTLPHPWLHWNCPCPVKPSLSPTSRPAPARPVTAFPIHPHDLILGRP